ncbi:MAG: DNA methyltransferase, partial [Candidatus Calescibacterium sp.]|nr:DNA methyltransferase [Candidatus Calescibacterium sp.]
MNTVSLNNSQNILFTFNKEKNNNNSSELIIKDREDTTKYKTSDIINKVIMGDALEVMKKFDSEIFDCVFIDPPYFLQLPKKKLLRWGVKTMVDGVDDAWDKFSSFEKYDNFITNLLTEVKRVLKPNGTKWIMGTYHNIFRI